MKLPQKIEAWAASGPGKKLQCQEFPMPDLTATEVALEVQYCGVCHSDLHLINNDWQISEYPLVPGHEIIGRVVGVGSAVKSLELGAIVGVGWQRNACGRCEECRSGHDNMCSESHATCLGHQGGYASFHVSEEKYCFLLPKSLQVPEAAPLLCGGITVYSPLREFLRGKKNPSVGIVGVGGLGHLAVKIAKAMGAEVTVYSSSADKEKETKAFGAQLFVHTKNPEAISGGGRHHDLVLVTANVDLPWNEYLKTLRAEGTLCFVGIPPSEYALNISSLLGKRLRISGSPIGSRKEILEMLSFCDEHKILATAERFPMDQVDAALERVKKNTVRYRAVLLR